MSIVIINGVAFLTGVFASMGLGGGMVLIIYLTVFVGVNQLTAQGINLIFFLPIAALSLIIHTKNKLVQWKKIVPTIIVGTISVIIGSYAATMLNTEILKKLFAVFIIAMGIKEIFTVPRKLSYSDEKQDSFRE